MRDAIALLRTLTLPAGATSGERIVLNGDTGTIEFYDANDHLILTLSPDGIIVYDTTANQRLIISTLVGAVYSALQLRSGVASETDGGLLSLQSWNAQQDRMVLGPGQINSAGSLELAFLTAAGNDSAPSMLTVVAQTLDRVGMLRPIIDLTGSGAPQAIAQPDTVVYDLWYGLQNGVGNAPVRAGSYGRGIIDRVESNADVTLSTTAGTYTTMISSNLVTCKQNRLYKISVSTPDNLVIGGSGFAVGDTWRWRLMKDVNGAGAVPLGAQALARANVAVSQRYAMCPLFSMYSPPADSSVQFREEAAKTSGAATVTSQTNNDGGNNYVQLIVEDVGYSSSAVR
jgi:hypothetical protein